MIQISRTEIKLPFTELQKKLQEEFAEKHCVLLPNLIETSLLNYLLKKLTSVQFIPKLEMDDNDAFGKILFVPLTEPVLFVFHMILNNPKFFEAVRQITDCDKIGNFFGRIHRSEPDSSHQIDWHGDNADNRLLGITVNLSTESYAGGLFKLREKNSQNIVCEKELTQAGDAFIFRISPNLQHCLTAVKSGGRRTVGVGWFRSKPDWDTFSKDYFRL